jgi:hypothetical protein
MSNAAAFSNVRGNIQNGCGWFKGTNSAWQLMSAYASSKEIPDASSSNPQYNCNAASEIFNSHQNSQGSHASLYNHLRLRSGSYLDPKSHSIWFRVPLALLLSAHLPPLSLPVTNGLIAMYTADSWRPAESGSSASWTDLSGSGNHVTEVGGTTTISVARPIGAPAYVQGASTAWMKFPAGILPLAQYTLFYVARYNGAARGRIFQGMGTTNWLWLSGFFDNKMGVAFHGSCYWITPTNDLHGSDWVLGSDRSDSFRSNGVDRTTNTANNCQTFDRLAINTNLNTNHVIEPSDFAIQSVLVYNVKLSDADVQRVEAWLNAFQPAFTPANLQARARHRTA